MSISTQSIISQLQTIQNMTQNQFQNPTRTFQNIHNLFHFHKSEANFQLSIQKFTTQNSMLLIDSQIPTLKQYKNSQSIYPKHYNLKANYPLTSIY